jgi:cation diffusion facilitator CzcD-associated flavoprotein CzcO
MAITAGDGSEENRMPHEHFDVLIIGAGLSGIGAACHLQADCPGKTYAILEARERMGGTWDLFRYPGIRSDSDMFTLGYDFRPWRESQSIADGPSILRYVRETAADHGVDRHIRYGRRAVAASWSSQDARWTVEAENAETGETERLTCSFLYANTGYYRYDQGYDPQFSGTERFQGEIVHPQHWPEDLDYTGKRVVVIGSGATAVTLVPAMAPEAGHVTMLQRSPSYVVTLPGSDPFANAVRRLLPPHLAHTIVRWKNVLLTTGFYKLSRRAPRFMAGLLRRAANKRLPEGYEVDVHFKPTYQPWDQRLCLVPDGDLFEALSNGSASIVTDRIETFTERGLRLQSGAELEADVIVTATGLNIRVLGDMSLTVDGHDVDVSQTVGYKGAMFSGLPNFAMTFGYTNASWTLKADLIASFVCRLINHMDARGFTRAVPLAPDPSLPRGPFLDLTSGYVQRALDKLPKQGPHEPWRLYQNYPRDVAMLRHGTIDDGVLALSRGGEPVTAADADARELLAA